MAGPQMRAESRIYERVIKIARLLEQRNKSAR